MPLAMVGSPICSCQRETGKWEVSMVERRACGCCETSTRQHGWKVENRLNVLDVAGLQGRGLVEDLLLGRLKNPVEQSSRRWIVSGRMTLPYW